MQYPYDSTPAAPESDTGPESVPRFEVQARLNLAGLAEFAGVRHHHDKAPTSEMRVCGVDLVFNTPEESEQFARAAAVTADQHRIAWQRNGLAPAESVDLAAPQ
ncbi:hypothetical protein ACWEU6_36175 [Streptosporangium sandarakinum]